MDILEVFKKKFHGKIIAAEAVGLRRVYIRIKPESLAEAVGLLIKMNTRFITISGIDEKEYIEAIYHFSDDKNGCILSLRVILPGKHPELSSVRSILPAAVWIESEISELIGINFGDIPALSALFLSKDYRGRKQPLRKN